MVFMQQRNLQQASRCDVYITICKILLKLFYIWTLYVSGSDYKMIILKMYTVQMRLHAVTKF